MKIQTVFMAAGEGTRMRSDVSKVLHKISGKTLLDWAMAAAPQSEEKPIIVVGKNEAAVRQAYGDRVRYALQRERLGTGHAVMMARAQLQEGNAEAVLILAGDMPLFRRETLERLCQGVVQGRCDAAVLTAVLEDSTGYGRILRDEQGHVVGVVEQKDATPAQLAIREANVSGYCVRRDLLFDALDRLRNENAQKEYYITDIVGILAKDGRIVEPCVAADATECMGINDRVQLAQAQKMMNRRICTALMQSGVTMIDPENTYVEADVQIGRDTIVYPGNVLAGNTHIGSGCTIYSGCRMEDSVIGDNVTVTASVLLQARVGNDTTVGPFAYLRPDSVIGQRARIGDFVEIKNSVVGDDTKVSHLTYIGDADVGQRVNVGCGTVFVNYDGKRKYRTSVGDDVFIGCNTNLVSPVQVGDGAYIAAGSTVTQEVPEDALAIARARQVNKPGWARKKRSEP